MHLRAKGAAVYGFGCATRRPSRSSMRCSRFLFLDKLRERRRAEPSRTRDAGAAPSAPLRATTAQLKQDARLVMLLRNAVQAAADDEGWARVGAVRQPDRQPGLASIRATTATPR